MELVSDWRHSSAIAGRFIRLNSGPLQATCWKEHSFRPKFVRHFATSSVFLRESYSPSFSRASMRVRRIRLLPLQQRSG